MTYPPGVTTGMIPGFRKEDVDFDRYLRRYAEELWQDYCEDTGRNDVDEWDGENMYYNDADFEEYVNNEYEAACE